MIRNRQLACLVTACLAPLLTTGCSGSDAPDPKPHPPSTTPAHDLAACEDGDCTVTVREGDVIPFGHNVQAPDLTIDALGPTGLTLRLAGNGTTSTFSAQSGGVSTYNETDFRVLEITATTALLRISPNGG